MDNEERNLDQSVEEPGKGYIPRPAWQVWGARIGLVIMIISVLLYFHYIANGGLL